jgi:hypothetical protein
MPRCSMTLIFLTHSSEPVGHEYAGKGSVTPDVLYRFVLAFPGLKLVCAHWGGGLPFYALMPEVEKALANVFFDTAATVFLYKPEVFEHVSRVIGSMTGSFSARIILSCARLELSPRSNRRAFLTKTRRESWGPTP